LERENETLRLQIREALEQRTATSEILHVISGSPTDVQPVFDTIARSAVRLCDARFALVYRLEGEIVHLVSHHNYPVDALEQFRRTFSRRLSEGGTVVAQAMLRGDNIHIHDIEQHMEFSAGVRELARSAGYRSVLAVPMMREGRALGALAVTRSDATGAPKPFSAEEIALLKTFTAQAVVAIENVRLFKELEARTAQLTRSVAELRALGEVSHAVSSTLDVEKVLNTIVVRASQLAGADGCSIYEYDETAGEFALRATYKYEAEYVEALRASPLRKGEGVIGLAARLREPVQVPDINVPGAYQSGIRGMLLRLGYRALLSVPLLRDEQVVGSLSLNRKAPGEFPPGVVDVLKTFATQSVQAIQNARLFREIADKSAQLESASRHKSEFLANMSHELRTPLNAIIGFSEVLSAGMVGDLNDKQAEYLQDILESGQHLLSLINDILDLSKVEAGRMELEPEDYDLPGAINNALILVKERANRRGIALGSDVDERLGTLRGDERKVKQVILNLLSNALKFTPEGGKIDVNAVLREHVVEVSVSDTGIGIAPAHQAAVFEAFHQVGTAEKKAEGTGLGLALSRKFIELHGGEIWVRSRLGAGSTFTFTLPLTTDRGRNESRKA
jgi:signal transduction histidine kinase